MKRILSFLLSAVFLFSMASDNLDYGIPSEKDVILLDRAGYAAGYSLKHRQSVWTCYRLLPSEVNGKAVNRNDRFMADEKTGKDVSPKDYESYAGDKGHLVPAADMLFSERTMKDSFLMSNISPQLSAFNRGIWKSLENRIREWAKSEPLFIYTGPVFFDDSLEKVNGKIDIPHAFYKVVYAEKSHKMIGFLIPNRKCGDPIRVFAVSVRLIESITGLDFFGILPKPEQEKLETSTSAAEWDL